MKTQIFLLKLVQFFLIDSFFRLGQTNADCLLACRCPCLYLILLLYRQVPACEQFVLKHCLHILRLSAMHMTANLLKLYSCMLKDLE